MPETHLQKSSKTQTYLPFIENNEISGLIRSHLNKTGALNISSDYPLLQHLHFAYEHLHRNSSHVKLKKKTQIFIV